MMCVRTCLGCVCVLALLGIVRLDVDCLECKSDASWMYSMHVVIDHLIARTQLTGASALQKMACHPFLLFLLDQETFALYEHSIS